VKNDGGVSVSTVEDIITKNCGSDNCLKMFFFFVFKNILFSIKLLSNFIFYSIK
jgi:hypothetical protein